jgi:AP-2 complex subunit alpha
LSNNQDLLGVNASQNETVGLYMTPHYIALCSNQTIQLGIKSEYRGNLEKLTLFFGKKTKSALTSFSVQINSDPALKINFEPASAIIAPQTQIQCTGIFGASPSIVFSFSTPNGSTSVASYLPITLTKFIEGVSIEASDFMQRWNQLSDTEKQKQRVIQMSIDTADKLAKALCGSGFQLLNNDTPGTLSGVGIANVGNTKIGCLIRMEFNAERKVFFLHDKRWCA